MTGSAAHQSIEVNSLDSAVSDAADNCHVRAVNACVVQVGTEFKPDADTS